MKSTNRFVTAMGMLLLICVALPAWAGSTGGDSFVLPLAAERMLSQIGFAVLDQEYPTFSALYQDNQSSRIPQFITSDSVLYLTHAVLSASIRAAEIGSLKPALEAFMERLWGSCVKEYDSTQELQVQEALGETLVYLCVGLRLLGKDQELPSPLSEWSATVEKEVALIEAHAAALSSPILGYEVDYTQYKPRGHYTVSEDFARYFKAFKWFTFPFRLIDPSETLEALLIAELILQDDELLTAWKKIDEFQAFLVGPADDLSIQDYAALLTDIYGEERTIESFTDQERLGIFIDRVRETLPKPRALPYWAAVTMVPREAAQGFALFPSRLVPDSWIFQELVYDKVGTQEKPRVFPKGLDLFAVLGSDVAREILQAEGDFEYAGYEAQLSTLQGSVDELTQEWAGTLYWEWLSSLMALQSPSRVVGFPTSAAWEYKQLTASLGGWTLLRHDTVLYAKESVAMAMGLYSYTAGYVEPYPLFYNRLGTMLTHLENHLGQMVLAEDLLGFTSEDLHLSDLQQFLVFLERVAQKEVDGEALSEEEYQAIWDVGDTFRELRTFSSEVTNALAMGDAILPVVADVHTDPNSGNYLLEGVGHIRPIWIAITHDEQTKLMRGGVFSYYEWDHPERLTDDEWRVMLEEEAPETPEWTGVFMVFGED